MIISRTFLINPLLELELETSDQNLLRLFEVRFGGLSSFFDQASEPGLRIRIQQVSKICLSSPRSVRNLGLPDDLCLFDEKDFVIVRDKRRIRIPFLEIGQSSELLITFEKGFPVDWLRRYLDGLIAFHLLGSDATLYHAACIGRGDCEIVIAAWRGTGKTSLSLDLLENQYASYKAEDQFVLRETGESYVYTDASHVDFSHMQRFHAIKGAHPSLSFSLRTSIARIILPLASASSTNGSTFSLQTPCQP